MKSRNLERTLKIVSLLVLLILMSASCALNTSVEKSLAERLAQFPTSAYQLNQGVVIRWNEHQVPFIEAETDEDLAFALGLVHMHLRESQLEFLRKVSQGRISEMAGPFAAEIDHSLRILNFGHAAKESLKQLPAETKRWVKAFVAGLNAYQTSRARPQPDAALFGYAGEAWTEEDVFTIGRLAATDVNWLSFFALLEERNKESWPSLWAEIKKGAAPMEGRASGLLNVSKAGSNSIVVSGEKSVSGAPLVANDPHLGFLIPNIWLLAGVRSPSYHAVGLMIPGVPVIALGRNPHVAWGGTNMRALSSDLVVLDEEAKKEIISSETTIEQRFWFSRTEEVRWSPYGPVITDSPLLSGKPGEDIALRWVGHSPSDEIGSFLKGNRARTVEEFRDAFRDYAVSGQNLLFADTAGNIGHIYAARNPVRPFTIPEKLVLSAEESPWTEFRNASQRQARINPESGILVSANNRPRYTDEYFGFSFSPDDRVDRLKELAEAKEKLSLEDLTAMQLDTFSRSAKELSNKLALILEHSTDDTVLSDALRGWDGYYRVDSREAYLFELFLGRLLKRLYADEFGKIGRIYSQWQFVVNRLPVDLAALSESARRTLLNEAVADTLSLSGDEKTRWGDIHRLRIGPVSSQLPYIGWLYRDRDIPIGGSRETLMKTSHGVIEGEHATRFGSQARHLSDLSDLDENYFVILGGQDGWRGSSTYLDQADLWLQRRYIKMPLRKNSVEAAFPYITRIDP